MRYIEIAPKFTYFLGLITHVSALIFLSIICSKLLQSDNTFGLVIAITMACFWLLSFLFVFLKKAIYARIDCENKILIFGNIFFHQKASLDNVQNIERKWYSNHAYGIEISSKKYSFTNPELNLKNVKRLLLETRD